MFFNQQDSYTQIWNSDINCGLAIQTPADGDIYHNISTSNANKTIKQEKKGDFDYKTKHKYAKIFT